MKSTINKNNINFIFYGARPNRLDPQIEFSLKAETSRLDSSYVGLINESLRKAVESPINKFRLRNMEGMLGQGFRSFLNSLVTEISNRGGYLEIGAWKGSTVVSVLWNNDKKGILVNDWSQFGGPRKHFMKVIKKFIGFKRVEIVESDFYLFSNKICNSNICVYFYDGNHSAEYQEAATVFIDKLKFEYLVFIVDDYNWDDAKNDTNSGLVKIKSILISTWVIAPNDSDKKMKYGNWHNGYLIALLN